MAKNQSEMDEWAPREDEEEVGGDLNIWNPALDGKKGDELAGEVIVLDEGVYGIQAQIDIGKDEKGKSIVMTTPAHRILQTALKNIVVGDHVRITFTGDYKTPAGKTTNTYRVARKKQ